MNNFNPTRLRPPLSHTHACAYPFKHTGHHSSIRQGYPYRLRKAYFWSEHIPMEKGRGAVRFRSPCLESGAESSALERIIYGSVESRSITCTPYVSGFHCVRESGDRLTCLNTTVGIPSTKYTTYVKSRSATTIESARSKQREVAQWRSWLRSRRYGCALDNKNGIPYNSFL